MKTSGFTQTALAALLLLFNAHTAAAQEALIPLQDALRRDYPCYVRDTKMVQWLGGKPMLTTLFVMDAPREAIAAERTDEAVAALERESLKATEADRYRARTTQGDSLSYTLLYKREQTYDEPYTKGGTIEGSRTLGDPDLRAASLLTRTPRIFYMATKQTRQLAAEPKGFVDMARLDSMLRSAQAWTGAETREVEYDATVRAGFNWQIRYHDEARPMLPTTGHRLRLPLTGDSRRLWAALRTEIERLTGDEGQPYMRTLSRSELYLTSGPERIFIARLDEDASCLWLLRVSNQGVNVAIPQDWTRWSYLRGGIAKE